MSGVREVDRREVVQVSAIFFFPSMGLLKISALFILFPPDFNGVLTTFPCSSSGIPLLSNDLVATEFRHASCSLIDFFEQDSKVLSMLGILL